MILRERRYTPRHPEGPRWVCEKQKRTDGTVRLNVNAPSTTTTLLTQAEAMEVLRVATAFAQRAHGAGLGIGHLEAPEMVHKEHASWMKARMEDRQNWSSIDAGEGVGPEDGGKGRAQREPRRLVVLLHGLEGSSTAPLTKRFSSVYSRNG